jgi:hypothetical protein
LLAPIQHRTQEKQVQLSVIQDCSAPHYIRTPTCTGP